VPLVAAQGGPMPRASLKEQLVHLLTTPDREAGWTVSDAQGGMRLPSKERKLQTSCTVSSG
jgi:hypothetical protein